MGELMVIVSIGWGSLLFANYNVSYESFHRNSVAEANTYLFSAEKIGKPTQNNLISTRNIDESVNNTFAAGYCTYGAARISPEFFPYSGNTQQRTRGGNAIDRCENAATAGFTIGKNPSVGALIIYNPGNGISTLGHVGKIMFYNNTTKYMIVRDMNRIGKSIMSDHRDSITTANVKCFIYPKKTEISTEVIPTVETGTTTGTGTIVDIIPPVVIEKPSDTNTGVVIYTGTVNTGIVSTGNINTGTNLPVNEDHGSAPTTTLPNQEPEKEVVTTANSTTKEINLDIKNISDISKHFMDQYTFSIKKVGKDTLSVGDTITLLISAKGKNTNTSYKGILPFLLTIITNNTNMITNVSRIQLLQNDEMEISIKAKNVGTSTIVLSIDDEPIAKIPVTIKN